MPNPFIVSRRKAAIVIAGTLAASARSAGAASLRPDAASLAARSARGSLDDHHRSIAGSLRGVRRAEGAQARAQAFERCKAALRAHDLSEASAVAGAAGVSGTRTAASGLYRSADPSTVLSQVIVRELDAWPVADAGWLERFADLEAAFQTHVAERRRTERASPEAV